MREKINWAELNKTIDLLKASVLMCGEEDTISDELIRNANSLITSAVCDAASINFIITKR